MWGGGGGGIVISGAGWGGVQCLSTPRCMKVYEVLCRNLSQCTCSCSKGTHTHTGFAASKWFKFFWKITETL